MALLFPRSPVYVFYRNVKLQVVFRGTVWSVVQCVQYNAPEKFFRVPGCLTALALLGPQNAVSPPQGWSRSQIFLVTAQGWVRCSIHCTQLSNDGTAQEALLGPPPRWASETTAKELGGWRSVLSWTKTTSFPHSTLFTGIFQFGVLVWCHALSDGARFLCSSQTHDFYDP